MKMILLDIEGTTSDIHFVHKVLFPYSRKKMASYLESNRESESVRKAIDEVTATLREEDQAPPIDTAELTTVLVNWIDGDRKHPSLKRIQGEIWKEGFEGGEFQSHIYEDVLPMIQKWHESGLCLGIYSSGSIGAQKLFFSHTTEGDLTSYFSYHFDLGVGGKKEAKSYESIVRQVEIPADQILFLSDVPEELDAAKAAGLEGLHVVRPGTSESDRHDTVKSFLEVKTTLRE